MQLNIPRKTRNNGTLYMHVVMLDDSKLYKSFDEIRQTHPLHTWPLIKFVEPQAATFNLLQHNVSVFIKDQE